MSKYDCLGNAKLRKCRLDQFCLGIGRPHRAARTLAVAEAWAIENDDPIILGGKVDQTAGFEILDHASVTVQKHDGIACATFDVVKPHAVDVKESAHRRIVTFRLVREISIDAAAAAKAAIAIVEAVTSEDALRFRRRLETERRRRFRVGMTAMGIILGRRVHEFSDDP